MTRKVKRGEATAFAIALVSDAVEHLSASEIDTPEMVDALNQMKVMLHKISPFASEPVDCVLWVPADSIAANDYNPNRVAPPEMELLQTSIREDGYTQPIVAWKQPNAYEVVDGFHRNRVGKECPDIRERVHGYLPVVAINTDQGGRGDRIASTIRHNRARGKHTIDGMTEIVVELKRRNWSDKKIAKKLGMDPDEILRLSQISGLADIFANHEFSEAWEAENMADTDYVGLGDDEE